MAIYTILSKLRQEGDYGDLKDFTAEEVLPKIPEVQEFIAKIESLIEV